MHDLLWLGGIVGGTGWLLWRGAKGGGCAGCPMSAGCGSKGGCASPTGGPGRT
jgi:hypothetical protein